MRILKVLEEPEDRHIFFKTIVPTLHTFTEDETITFLMGVTSVQLLTNSRAGFKHNNHTQISTPTH